MAELLTGLAEVLTPTNLLYAFFGVLLGTFVGVLPGLGPTVTMALLRPLTYVLNPAPAFIMFAGIYYGAAYGGSTTSILPNTPGKSTSVITTIDEYARAKAGHAGPALASAAIGSFVAGTVGTFLLAPLAPVLAGWATTLQAADYFSLIVLALAGSVAFLGSSVPRGLASLFFGLALSTIGTDNLTGQHRPTFGISDLSDGLSIAIVAVGLFAVGEVLYSISVRTTGLADISVQGAPRMTREDWKRSWKPWLRGTAIGFTVGSLPIGGGEIATSASYSVERRFAGKNATEFGRGAIEGVAGPEAANNASTTGSFIPLLTLGLPTSNTAAILLIAFQIYAIQPGPLIFQNSPDIVWPLLASMLIGNVFLVIVNLPLVRFWVGITRVPTPILGAIVLLVSCVGAFSLSGNPADVLIVIIFGIIGMLMRRFDFPLVPAVMGLVLGGYLERYLRQSLQAAQGDVIIYVTRPISAILLSLPVVLFVLPLIIRITKHIRRARAREPFDTQ